MQFNEAKTLFLDTVRRTSRFGGAVTLLYWDMQTGMPKKAATGRAQIIGAVQAELFRMSTSDAFGGAITTLKERPDALSPRERRMVEEADFEYARFKKIPPDLFEAFTIAESESSHAWMEAKRKNDYAAFKPHLEKMIDYSRRYAELWGYEDKPYDAMLAGYDRALLTAQIDPIFERLLAGTRTLLARVGTLTPLPAVTVDDARQQAVGEYLLRTMGYDMDAGRLDTTEHPFTCGVSAGDVRVTTKYHPGEPLSSIFSVLHEGGHGMYDQRIDPELDGTNLAEGASMAIHESQSRFWENMVGRSRGFWQAHLAKVNQLCGVALAPDADTFYRGINAMRPSLIRIEADELTYNLHIIIRYECEKAIFNDNIAVDELPELWREKYREYLGIAPETYAEGIMQDSHWAGASFGYFPSYALGNLCAAQLAEALEKAHGPVDTLAGTPEGIAAIGGWLYQNVHRFGKEKKPAQIMLDACGADVDPAAFLRHMERKIAQVYG